MAKISLSAPWVEYYNRINELFRYDPEIKVIFDEAFQMIKIYAATDGKYQALTAFLPKKKTFGKLSIHINVIPPNEMEENEEAGDTDPFDLILTLFRGNDAISYIYQSGDGPFEFKALYVVFKHEIVQYFSDDLGDIHGFHSTLYQDIARDVLQTSGYIYFCTDFKDSRIMRCQEDNESYGKPLGEWP